MPLSFQENKNNSEWGTEERDLAVGKLKAEKLGEYKRGGRENSLNMKYVHNLRSLVKSQGDKDPRSKLGI